MRIDIMTLFPGTMDAVLNESIIGRARKKGAVEINCVQIRDYTENKQMQVDDYPYGGGWGCIMMAQPLKSCLYDIMSTAEGLRSRVIYMSPQGKPYDQAAAKRLVGDYDHLVLVCGHYEGVDERFIEECVDEEISLGDFVLTGGELAAMAVTDSVCRLVPGVLSDAECYTGESHWNGLLEYPQYTRPEVWEGRRVPEVLIRGDHDKVDEWRREMCIKRTMEKRPDMFEKLAFSEKSDRIILEKIKKDESRLKLTERLECRPAKETDIDDIMAAVADARKVFKKHRVDQWQGEYPTREVFLADMAEGDCFVVTHGGETAGFFVIKDGPEPDYDGITDGKWHWEGKYCVAHRAALAAKYKGTGMAELMFGFMDDVAAARGAAAIRTDTHRKNEPMKKLFVRCGYRYRGNVIITCDLGHDAARQCFEKGMKR